MDKATVSVTPSLNELHGNRWQMLNWKKQYLGELKNYDLVYKLKEPVKVKLYIIRYGSRLLDKTNLVGGVKPLEDAIKELGLIVDDSLKWCETIVTQEIVPRYREKTVFWIEEEK